MKLVKIISFVRSHVQGMRLSQLKGLVAMSEAVMKGAKLGVASIGRGMRGEAKVKHRIKRVDRFLGNSGVSIYPVCRSFLKLLSKRGQRLVILLDWTTVGQWDILLASVPMCGRGIPVLWQVCPRWGHELSRNRDERNFLLKLKAILPAGIEVIIVADRGFGRTELFRYLQQLGFSYVIRVKGDVRVEGKRYSGVLRRCHVNRATVMELGQVWYRAGRPVLSRIVGFWDWKQKERWWLSTNLKLGGRKVINIYSRRMQIEEMIRDEKNPRWGFGLRWVKLSNPHRWERMLLIAAVAYFILALYGLDTLRTGEARSFSSNTKRTLSILGCGMLYFAYAKASPKQLYQKLKPLIFKQNWG